jgi:hypothetical protein
MGGLIVVAVIVAGVAGFLVYQRSVEEERALNRQHDEDWARRRAEGDALAQATKGIQLAIGDSRRRAMMLPALVGRAEEAVNRAQFEFDEGAYGPFWTAVEAAAMALADYDESVRTISASAGAYAALAVQLKPPIPVFDLGIEELPSVVVPMQRMEFLVREAQKDYHFAAIYEQRKTNQILIAGFQSLDQAIWQLGDRLESSLGGLSDSLTSTMTDGFATQTAALTTAMAATSATQTQSLAGQSRSIRDELRESRRIAENESRARIRSDRNSGDLFAR